MTRTLTRLPPPSTRPEGHPGTPWLSRGCDTVLDLSVGFLASWTVVYHVCLLFRLAMPWAVVLELAALAGWAALVWRSRQRDREQPAQPDPPEPDPADPDTEDLDPAELSTPAASASTSASSSMLDTVLVSATVACALAAAVLFAFSASWPVIATLWMAAALAGTAWAVIRLSASNAAPSHAQPVDTGLIHTGAHATAVTDKKVDPTFVALAWAVALAVLSTFTRWPNPDDLYYVNLSQWVVDHGTFPLRDTIFSDQVFPMSSWPPMASYDALAGTVARLMGVHAATVVYIGVPPLATFLSVLALWRLLRAWRVRALSLALSLALLFLLFDGGFGYAAPGNLFLIRIWQGKVILLCLLVPLLLTYALRYVERPTWSRAGWLFAGGVAAVGLSTTAMFLVPLLAVGGAAPLVLRQPRLALRGFAAMAAYPLAAGALTKAVGGRSADLFGTRELYRFDPEWFGHQIFRDGPLAAIVVVAVLTGVLFVPRPAARVTTGVLTAMTGLTFVPGFTHLTYDLVGLGPTLWRVSWVASIAALVGVVVSTLATYPARRSLQVVGPLVLVVALVGFGTPIWSERNGVTLALPPHWQRGHESVTSAQYAIAAAKPGDLILAPEQLAITIDVLTTRVKTVAPRDYFMDYLRDDPDFHYQLRLNMIDFANREGSPPLPQVIRGLNVLGVDEVCLPSRAERRIAVIKAQGYRSVESSPWYDCMMPPQSSP